MHEDRTTVLFVCVNSVSESAKVSNCQREFCQFSVYFSFNSLPYPGVRASREHDVRNRNFHPYLGPCNAKHFCTPEKDIDEILSLPRGKDLHVTGV